MLHVSYRVIIYPSLMMLFLLVIKFNILCFTPRTLKGSRNYSPLFVKP